jgi:mannose-6-phosphate isomerase
VDGVLQEELVECRYFTLQRRTSQLPFSVGAAGRCRVVVCIAGSGELEYQGQRYSLCRGDTILLPAAVGQVLCRPRGEIVILECGLPE